MRETPLQSLHLVVASVVNSLSTEIHILTVRQLRVLLNIALLLHKVSNHLTLQKLDVALVRFLDIILHCTPQNKLEFR